MATLNNVYNIESNDEIWNMFYDFKDDNGEKEDNSENEDCFNIDNCQY
jgi:hypothetical protein